MLATLAPLEAVAGDQETEVSLSIARPYLNRQNKQTNKNTKNTKTKAKTKTHM
jgi:hypothetical protein